jgi:hypothetical protein
MSVPAARAAFLQEILRFRTHLFGESIRGDSNAARQAAFFGSDAALALGSRASTQRL